MVGIEKKSRKTLIIYFERNIPFKDLVAHIAKYPILIQRYVKRLDKNKLRKIYSYRRYRNKILKEFLEKTEGLKTSENKTLRGGLINGTFSKKEKFIYSKTSLKRPHSVAIKIGRSER